MREEKIEKGRGAQWVHFSCTISKVFKIQHISYFFTLNFRTFLLLQEEGGWAVRRMGRLNSKYVKHLTIFPAAFEGAAIVRDGHWSLNRGNMSRGRLSEGHMSVGALVQGLLSVHRPLSHGVLRNGARYEQCDFSQHSFHTVSDTQKCGMGISLSGALRNLKRGRGAQWVHFSCTFSKVFKIQHRNYFITLNFSTFFTFKGGGMGGQAHGPPKYVNS